jgi:hypothetical protein
VVISSGLHDSLMDVSTDFSPIRNSTTTATATQAEGFSAVKARDLCSIKTVRCIHIISWFYKIAIACMTGRALNSDTLITFSAF